MLQSGSASRSCSSASYSLLAVASMCSRLVSSASARISSALSSVIVHSVGGGVGVGVGSGVGSGVASAAALGSGVISGALCAPQAVTVTAASRRQSSRTTVFFIV